MATNSRQPKPNRRGGTPTEPARRAWTGARASPTFSPPNSSTPRPTNGLQTNQNNFPPLSQTNGPKPDSATERILRSLSGLTGTTITLLTKTEVRYEGVITSTNNEGDTTGVTLKDVKDITNPGAPLKDQLFIAATNIESWTSGPADAKLTNGDSFRTDTDISGKAGGIKERELQAWQPDAPPSHLSQGHGDEATFGMGANNGAGWDQFATNKELFGVTTSFDENVYTTQINRNHPDFKEREKKAQQLADEIIGAATTNIHIAEERNQAVDDSGVNEEDKYSTVVRGANAYVPPAARKGNPSGTPASSKPETPAAQSNGADGSALAILSPPTASKSPSPAPSSSNAKPPADAVPAFRDFVTNERQRLTQKRQALVKNEMDKKMAELVAFSRDFKLNKPIPDDLVPILAKDEEKQKAIKEKATKDATSNQARSIGPQSTAGASGASNARAAQQAALAKAAGGAKPSAAPAASKPVAGSTSAANVAQKPAPKPDTKTGNGKIFIQPIPPFKPKSASKPAPPPANGSAVTPPSGPGPAAAPTPAVKPNPNNQAWLNANASAFRPNPKANSFTPGPPSSSPGTNGASPSPRPKDATPNPFFGTRAIKKTPLVNVKDDFNPFKHNKVAEASAVSALWPYSGKRYAQMFPTPQHPPPQHSPVPPPVPPPMVAPTYEEDPNAQAVAAAAAAAAPRYVYYPPPYGYAPQHMMPGMPPPGPPGTFIPAPYMQAMPYPPPGMPPNMYPPPGMGQMPPPQAYMPPPPPPPGTYPAPPNGAGPRPSMPPTPIPSHAHPYYHSPQMQHAVAYPMMMPPPPNVQQHPYDSGPAQQVQMGNHT